MSPPYGWPIAGRYCATAGFFHPPCGMAVTLSFGRREPPELSRIMSFNSSLGTPTVCVTERFNDLFRTRKFLPRSLCSSNEREHQLLYPSKEGAGGHSEVAVINLSDAR